MRVTLLVHAFSVQDMIDFSMTIPIDDVEIHHFPLEIISEILQQVGAATASVRCRTVFLLL